MAAFATTDDLAKHWKGYDGSDSEYADQELANAALWLRVWFPGVADAALTNEDLREALVMVSCKMVKRALLNEDSEGLTSESETTGPFAYQVAFRNPDGDLFIKNAERQMIETLMGNAVSGAVSMTSRGM